MVDVHCHLTLLGQDDIKVGLAGLDAVITCGTSIEDSKKAIEIAEKHSNVWVCVGIHPEEISKFQFTNIKHLENLIKHPRVVGIGEVGLDYYQEISEEEKKKQRELLEIQLQLAEKYELPVEIHNRAADEETWNLITKYKIIGVMHCFTRNMEFMKKCAGKGWYISFGGLITYPNNDRMKKVAREVPIDKLLLETDSPYSFPEQGRKEINQPQNVKIVAGVIANLRGISEAEIDRITSKSARSLFNKLI
jgi:TatD DNase family protein